MLVVNRVFSKRNLSKSQNLPNLASFHRTLITSSAEILIFNIYYNNLSPHEKYFIYEFKMFSKEQITSKNDLHVKN